MRVENLSRGHWIVIAVLLGLATGWFQAGWGETNAEQTLSQDAFERGLVSMPLEDKKDHKQYPWITGIIIRPPVQAGFVVKRASGESYKPMISAVSCRTLHQLRDGQWQYRPGTFLAKDPYVPAPGPNSTPVPLRDYLKTVAASHPWVQYRYAWWTEPLWSCTIWVGICVLTIGIGWPIVLNRLMLAGYGRSPDPEATNESFLSRWFGGSDKPVGTDADAASARSATSLREMSQDDLDRIARMEAGLKDFVTNSAGSAAAAPDKPAAAVTPVQQLTTAPLEAPQEAAKLDEDKQYKGDFYPTAAHAKKSEQ